MDPIHFDELSRTISRLPSRRDALRALTAAGLGLGGLQQTLTVEARNSKRKGKKAKNRKDKNKKRIDDQNPPDDTPPPPPPPPGCTPTCTASNPCGDDGCGGSCGTCRTNEVCQSGTCICVPQCAPSNACGANGCGGSCGTCAGPTCQGTTLTTPVCNGGTCTPVVTSCGTGQVCFQNACCTKLPRPSCHKQPVSDGCGGTYPPNCGIQQHCCDKPNGDLICQALPCP
jgi:hypothetical protein